MKEQLMVRKMAIVYSVLAVLAVISAIGSASRVQRKRAGQLATAPAKAKLPPTPPQPTPSHPVQSPQPAADMPPPSVPAEPAPSQQQDGGPSIDPVAQELAESIMEMMPKIPLATTLTVGEVVNPQENELGAVQLDRVNFAAQHDAPTTQAHRGHNLLEEIAELEAGQGDRMTYLSQYVEHPDSVMRVSAAFALGELAARSQGQEQQELIGVLLRLCQDVDPLVRVQAGSALGAIDHPSIPTLE